MAFLGIGLGAANGMAAQFFWPDSTWLVHFSYFGFGPAGVFVTQFARSFLNTRTTSVWLDRSLIGVGIASAASTLMAAISYQTAGLMVSASLIMAMLLSGWAGIYSLTHKVPGGRLYLASWSVFLVFAMMLPLRNFGLVANNVLSAFGVQIGSLAEMMLLSFALAARINHIRAEKVNAQQAALDAQAQLVVNLRESEQVLEQRVAQEVEKNLRNERLLVQQSRLAAMGEMIGNIAHQWRQPLNALGLLLFNIKDEYHFNTLDAAYLDQAVADGSRMVQKMSTTISDFANFFRPDKEIKIFSALEQIKEAIALVESSFQSSHISIHIDAPLDLKLLGFPNEYSQVLLNLLTNAKEAILAHNQPHADRVDIILAAQDGHGCVSVCDNGGGIPEEILGRIFDPYFSTKGKGSGIGLYMSKMIIERNMNGSITARNIEGGAEFSVCTPLA